MGIWSIELFDWGDCVKLEKLSYRSFQKNYGKSVSFRGPGTFVSILRRKAVNAGVEVIEFSTHATRLSQTCPNCGAIHKKALSNRWHVCECGFGPIQRDILSAWLAKYVENDRLDVRRVRIDLPGADAFLTAASSEIEPAMGQGQPKPNLSMGQSWSPQNDGMVGGKACRGAVSGCGMRAANLTGTPRL
jgi:putative transposase